MKNHFQLIIMALSKVDISVLMSMMRTRTASFCLLNLVQFNGIRICCGHKPRYNSISYAYETKIKVKENDSLQSGCHVVGVTSRSGFCMCMLSSVQKNCGYLEICVNFSVHPL